MYVVVSVDILDLTQLDLLLKVQHLSPIYWAEGVSELFWDKTFDPVKGFPGGYTEGNFLGTFAAGSVFKVWSNRSSRSFERFKV